MCYAPEKLYLAHSHNIEESLGIGFIPWGYIVIVTFISTSPQRLQMYLWGFFREYFNLRDR